MSIIEPYWGEFLISPIPLELSLNYCSHKCAYCFANLNDPKRHGDIKKIMRFLADFHNRETLSAKLMQDGYPICISNRSDPFAYSNAKQIMPILETLAAIDHPVTFQTKGGAGIERAIELFPTAVWYISVSFASDDLRRKIEPGAPSIASRFELMNKVRTAGGRIILGLNPVVPEWLSNDEIELILDMAKANGAEGVWIEELHLNAKQIKAMSKSERESIGKDILTRSKKRRRDDLDSDAFFYARDTALAYGFEIFSNGQPNRSDIWDIYRDVYAKTFPTNQDFVNHCLDNGLHGGMLAFPHWYDVVGDLPGGKYRMNKYIGSSARSIFEEYKIPSKLTYTELLAVIWATKRAKQSPVRMPAFSYASVWAENGYLQLIDGSDMPYLVFDETGSLDSYYTPVAPIWSKEVAESGDPVEYGEVVEHG